jgi:hypothetical protein
VFIDQEKSSAMKYVGAIIRSPNPMYKSWTMKTEWATKELSD